MKQKQQRKTKKAKQKKPNQRRKGKKQKQKEKKEKPQETKEMETKTEANSAKNGTETKEPKPSEKIDASMAVMTGHIDVGNESEDYEEDNPGNTPTFTNISAQMIRKTNQTEVSKTAMQTK